jgi:GT2 family glycosyltransferase
MRLKKLKLLVGIPTLNRAKQLSKTLESISRNTIIPDKVLIVDQSDNDETWKATKEFMDKLNIEFLKVDYKGLTKARNEILERSGDFDVITFLDDDVVLHKDYLEKIIGAFENDRELAGCQGFIENQGGLRGFLFKVVNATPITLRPVVTRCFVNTYPHFPPLHPVHSEWLSGCNMSYRVGYIKNERFDENFILYGLGEDLEFSYRLFKKGMKLLTIPSAKLKHIPSGLKSLPNKAALMMRFAYRRYMIAKFYPEKKDKIFWEYVQCYKRSLRTLKIRKPYLWKEMQKLIDEVIEVLKEHFSSVDSGDLRRVNALILKEVHK